MKISPREKASPGSYKQLVKVWMTPDGSILGWVLEKSYEILCFVLLSHLVIQEAQDILTQFWPIAMWQLTLLDTAWDRFIRYSSRQFITRGCRSLRLKGAGSFWVGQVFCSSYFCPCSNQTTKPVGFLIGLWSWLWSMRSMCPVDPHEILFEDAWKYLRHMVFDTSPGICNWCQTSTDVLRHLLPTWAAESYPQLSCKRHQKDLIANR